MVKCDFKDNCTSRGHRCSSCARNQKQDYYIPKPYTPWWTEPWYRPRRRYIYTSTAKTTADTGDYYVSK